MSQTPEEIRREIDNTRGRLSTDVDAMADKVNPASVAHRQTEKVRSTLRQTKERIMGSTDNSSDSAQPTLQDAGETIRSVPGQISSQTQGNPLAAGLIAFGAGWLLSALIPASDKEKELASTVKDKAQPLVDEVGQAAKQVADHMQEPAQNAVNEVKDSAAESAQSVKSEATSAASDVGGRAKEAQQNVKSS
ncbi:DUF3618 domain-containing protein [Paeniglutamicibacter antarcticus]|uniref:DUF3618 domain-containing protein n=1 Tax=Arthrobacter terrae TaxID=2935737 RepID=A0A931G4Q2_9MICC|nr:DUF3618 domain-containing protein [Arthrobacter terrae]MBG0739063.1 DUF3618 domain-containing protein [Arthrobacter terrae]